MKKYIYYYFYFLSHLKVYISLFAWLFIFVDLLLLALPVPKTIVSYTIPYLTIYLFFPWIIALFSSIKILRHFKPFPKKFSTRTYLKVLAIITLLAAPVLLINLIAVLKVKFGWTVI